MKANITATKNVETLKHILINWGNKDVTRWNLGNYFLRGEKTATGYIFSLRSNRHPRTDIFVSNSWDDLQTEIEAWDAKFYYFFQWNF